MGRGDDFEPDKQCARGLAYSFPDRFAFSKWPKVILRNGETVFPDFVIELDLPHLKERYLIECQDRSSNSKSILHKIEHVRAQSGKNNFIFLYNETATAETIRALRAEGILVFSYDEFMRFLDRIRISLGATAPARFDGGGGEDSWDSDVHEEE